MLIKLCLVVRIRRNRCMGSLDKESQFTARRQQTNNQHDLTFGKVLLQLARNTIWRHLDDKENLSHQFTNHPAPGDRSGVFVTLWGQSSTKQPGVASDYDELRGCIGRLQSNMPLNEAVQEAAIGAATRSTFPGAFCRCCPRHSPTASAR